MNAVDDTGGRRNQRHRWRVTHREPGGNEQRCKAYVDPDGIARFTDGLRRQRLRRRLRLRRLRLPLQLPRIETDPDPGYGLFPFTLEETNHRCDGVRSTAEQAGCAKGSRIVCQAA